jgi:hypothetical protein
MTKEIDEQFKFLLYDFHLVKIGGCEGYFFKNSINIKSYLIIFFVIEHDALTVVGE